MVLANRAGSVVAPLRSPIGHVHNPLEVVQAVRVLSGHKQVLGQIRKFLTVGASPRQMPEPFMTASGSPEAFLVELSTVEIDRSDDWVLQRNLVTRRALELGVSLPDAQSRSNDALRWRRALQNINPRTKARDNLQILLRCESTTLLAEEIDRSLEQITAVLSRPIVFMGPILPAERLLNERIREFVGRTAGTTFFDTLAFVKELGAEVALVDNGHFDESVEEELAYRLVDLTACLLARPSPSIMMKPKNKWKLHPYSKIPKRSSWTAAVASVPAFEIMEWAQPKRRLRAGDVIATGGSCFAQHISRNLNKSGLTFLDVEPAPRRLPIAEHHKHGYGIFSARYGNIYTAAHLRQLVERAYGRRKPSENPWTRDGIFFDPFRPQISPNGFSSIDQLIADTGAHLRRVAKMFKKVNVFVFTMGLTEGWRSKLDGSVFPVCPGVRNIGTFNSDRYEFVNFTFAEVLRDLQWSFNFLKRANPTLRFVLTVSPIPLAATASGEHVISATSYSKSLLRAVAGQLAQERSDTDYFPSYEIITAPVFKGQFYEQGFREVNPEGVSHVMDVFFREFVEGELDADVVPPRAVDLNTEICCDEKYLDSYGN